MSAQRIVVVDYGMGNLHSVASALAHVAPEDDIVVSTNAGDIAQADRIIFPGVGAIRDCVAEIKRGGFDTALAAAIASGVPVLGICVGMQVLMDSSEENEGVPALGLVSGQVKFFSEDPQFIAAQSQPPLKVPHMGWNEVRQSRPHPMWENIPDQSRFYFVHSYFVAPDDDALIAGACEFGIPFTAAIARKNLFAVQFHPEKSHTHGLQLLRNFTRWQGTD